MARSLGNEPKSGDNSDGAIDNEALQEVVGRAIDVMRQQKEWADLLKEICAEGDEAGVASKAEIRALARERFKHADKPEVLDAKLARMATLRAALGPFAETELGEAAISANGHGEKESTERRHTSIMPAREGKPGRKPKAQAAIEAAQAHLDAGGDFEDAGARVDADLQRIIDEHPPTA